MRLSAELIGSVNKDYKDNYDHYRFGEAPAETKKPFSLKNIFVSALNKLGYFNDFNNHLYSKQMAEIDYPFSHFIYLHNILEDEYSQELLVKIAAYRLLGYKKIKLPLSTPQFWKNQKLIESNQSREDFVDISFMNIRMPLTDLNFLGIPLKIYMTALGVNIDFLIKQYELHRGNIAIQAEAGDIVIDAGGCFGDTALYFADKVGKSGQVHVFEFIPDNIEIFDKNIGLNKGVENIVTLVPNPVWSSSGETVFYTPNGPGSKVSMEEFEGYTNTAKTLSIDDYVIHRELPGVDFIKMDIEGAELNALKGAENTIRKFTPILAVALYHSIPDFDILPRFINDLNLGYKFYLSHSTIFGEETMLFAVTDQ